MTRRAGGQGQDGKGDRIRGEEDGLNGQRRDERRA
jgi:hypothetical protein